jgi:spoIIIJ-associated protein
MSSCLEFEDKAVETAVEKACEALNIPKEKLQYKIISHGSSGIFGLVGAKKAKISVTIPDDLDIPMDPMPQAGHRKESDDTAPPKRAESPVPYADKQPDESVSPLISDTVDEPEQDDQEPPVLTEAMKMGHETLQRIIDFITTDAKIHIRKAHDRILFNVQGGNTGVLIGKRGQTLEAIQYLVEKVVNRHSEERVRLQVDVEGYLTKRQMNLESLAKRLAEKAKHTGKPSTIAQMNAHDRRIIHLALKNDINVRTQSVGDGFYRKLVIMPRRRGREKTY